jgi:RNA polymerase sigma-70 factor (ECF subfamily)
VPDQTDDERQLVASCLADRPGAFRRLVERFQTMVYGLCVRMLRDRHEAEDVAQEVFLRMHRSLHRWDAERPLRGWVLAIAANRCRTWLARRRPIASNPEILESAPDPRPDEGDGRELADAVREAVAELRPEYRRAFLLFHEQGLGYEEIGAAMGRPIGTLKTWLHRARSELQTKLRARGLLTEAVHDE